MYLLPFDSVFYYYNFNKKIKSLNIMNIKHKPGSGRRNKTFYNKGRQVDLTSLKEVKDILKGHSAQRDMLIEYLHLIQDNQGFLHAKHLRALSDFMGLPMAEIYEVTSFYAHFTIVDDDEDILPEVTLKVCDSITCELFGANELFEDLKNALPGCRLLKAPCMGRCDKAPIVEVNHNHILSANTKKIKEAIEEKKFHPIQIKYTNLDEYLKT